MKSPFRNEDCAKVRDALLTGAFNAISREQAEEHLASHEPCADWAAQLGLLSAAFSSERGRFKPHCEITDQMLKDCIEHNLSAPLRQIVEDACCHNLQLTVRLRVMRERLAQARVQVLDFSQARQFAAALRDQISAAISISLEQFLGLYLHKPVAVAAAQPQRSIHQTPDGRFVVSITDKGARERGAPRLIELGIRAHDPRWIGQWALYRITTDQGKLAAAGIVKVESHGTAVQVMVSPSDQGPYQVQVQVVEAGIEDIEAALEAVARKKAPPPGKG